MAENEKQHILLVDDMPENLIALEAVLEQPELEIIKATSGKEVAPLVSKYEFAVIIPEPEPPPSHP